jgi:hypothetical protein
MALSAANTQYAYMACGLWAAGTTRYRYRFNAFSAQSIEESSLSWSYADIKTALDTRLAALSDDQNTILATWLTTWSGGLTSSFRKEAGGDGVALSDEEEVRKAQAAIVQLIGIEVEPAAMVDDLSTSPRQGPVGR